MIRKYEGELEMFGFEKENMIIRLRIHFEEVEKIK